MKKTIFEQLIQIFSAPIKFGVKRGERILENAEKRYTKDTNEPSSSTESAPDLCRPIGSTFVVDDVELEVVEGATCDGCYFYGKACRWPAGRIEHCTPHLRSDHQNVIFKKVGKARTKNIIADLTKANISDIRELSQMFDQSLDGAEYCHEEEIKSLLMAHIEDIHALSRKFDEILDERLKIERDKAKDAFCNGCESLIPARCPCVAFDRFIEKLNAK